LNEPTKSLTRQAIVNYIDEAISHLEESKDSYNEAKERLTNLAIELGCNERSINNNHLVARAYLEGMRK